MKYKDMINPSNNTKYYVNKYKQQSKRNVRASVETRNTHPLCDDSLFALDIIGKDMKNPYNIHNFLHLYAWHNHIEHTPTKN